MLNQFQASLGGCDASSADKRAVCFTKSSTNGAYETVLTLALSYSACDARSEKAQGYFLFDSSFLFKLVLASRDAEGRAEGRRQARRFHCSPDLLCGCIVETDFRLQTIHLSPNQPLYRHCSFS